MKKLSARGQSRRKVLIKALSKELDEISKSPNIRSLKEGKELLCPYCNLPIKPCEKDKSIMCKEMIQGGTNGEAIEKALKNPEEFQYGVCLICGKLISTAHLKKHPNAELCSCCVKETKRIKKKKLSFKNSN